MAKRGQGLSFPSMRRVNDAAVMAITLFFQPAAGVRQDAAAGAVWIKLF